MRVLVIGAGPMGIAAAIGALDRGHEVTVLERGEVGASLRSWGPTRFFSPLRMNVTPRMRELLGDTMPDPEALLTGPEYVDKILLPLAARLDVRTNARVVAIGRRGLTRGDYAGHPLRAEKPFRLVVSCVAGLRPASGSPSHQGGPEARDARSFHESVLEGHAILDASGGLTIPRAIGTGGLPALGEHTLVRAPIRTLGALASADVKGKRVLVVGDGHSAANAIGQLEGIADVVWAVRTPNLRPCAEVFNDPLPERANVVARANALAAAPPSWLRVERRAMIDRVEQTNGHVTVTLTGDRRVEVDAIAAFTGYRPDASYLSELAVETSAVTEGGARLYRAISCVTDCLSVPAVKPEDLQSGEPGYFFVGSRAYGRSNGFLLQTGFAQLETILDALA